MIFPVNILLPLNTSQTYTVEKNPANMKQITSNMYPTKTLWTQSENKFHDDLISSI